MLKIFRLARPDPGQEQTRRYLQSLVDPSSLKHMFSPCLPYVSSNSMVQILVLPPSPRLLFTAFRATMLENVKTRPSECEQASRMLTPYCSNFHSFSDSEKSNTKQGSTCGPNNYQFSDENECSLHLNENCLKPLTFWLSFTQRNDKAVLIISQSADSQNRSPKSALFCFALQHVRAKMSVFDEQP